MTNKVSIKGKCLKCGEKKANRSYLERSNEANKSIKQTYVVACYNRESQLVGNKLFADETTKKGEYFISSFVLLGNRTEFYKGKKDKPLFLSLREEARAECIDCDRVWKVLANVKTGKILKFIKKNP